MRTKTARYNWAPKAVAERAATRYTVDGNGCHISDNPANDSGYAVIEWSQDGVHRSMSCARAAWTFYEGHPEPWQTIDHIVGRCHDRRCIRRDHLRLVSMGDNSIRAGQTEDWEVGRCRRGHPTDGQCRTCIYDVQVGQALGWSIAETAERIGISLVTVSRWRAIDLDQDQAEADRTIPPIDDPYGDDWESPEVPVDPATLRDAHLNRAGFWLEVA